MHIDCYEESVQLEYFKYILLVAEISLFLHS